MLNWFAKLWEIDEEEYWGYITNCGTEGEARKLRGAGVGAGGLPPCVGSRWRRPGGWCSPGGWCARVAPRLPLHARRLWSNTPLAPPSPSPYTHTPNHCSAHAHTHPASPGNLHGILVGRENLPDGILYASRETHYSVFKAARMYRMDAVKVGGVGGFGGPGAG